MQIVGTCSKCGGDVIVPEIWGGTIPPKPQCRGCGAVAKMPVIETSGGFTEAYTTSLNSKWREKPCPEK